MKNCLLLLCLAATTGCGAGLRLDVSEPSVQAMTEAQPVRLAWRLPEQMPTNYFFRFGARIRGSSIVNEEAEGIVHITNEGRVGEQFMRLALRRQELRRKHVEHRRGRQIIETKLRDFQPWIGPNIIRLEQMSTRVAHPVDDYWRFGIKESSPFHYVFYDSLMYLLPAFSGKEAAPGEEWEVLIPVIVNRIYDRNEFRLKCKHRLERLVRLPGGHRGAEISFSADGTFDTSAEAFAHRFDDAFRSRQRITNVVAGTGRAVFDLDAGLLVWKQMRYSVDVTRATEKTTRDTARKVARKHWEEETDHLEVDAVWRLRKPGERIRVRR